MGDVLQKDRRVVLGKGQNPNINVVLIPGTFKLKLAAPVPLEVAPQSRRVDFLRPKLANLECPLKWLIEAQKKNEILGITKREEFLKSWIDDTKHETGMKVAVWMTQQGVRLAYDIELKYFQQAKKVVETMQEFLKESVPIEITEPERFNAYKYFVTASEAHVEYAFENFNRVEQLLGELGKIDIKNKRTQSSILVLKANFYGHLVVNEKLELLEMAVQYDPESPDAQHYLYRGLRADRRERNFQSFPTEPEAEAAKKVIQLCPEVGWSNFDMATLNYDFHQGLSRGSRDREEHLVRAFNYVRKAKELNPGCISYSIKHAEFAVEINKGAGAEAKILFEACMEKWPQSSEVLHKYGKFLKNEGKMEEALKVLESSLDLEDHRNFPCLMDYIRYKSKDGDSEILEAILSRLRIFIKKMSCKTQKSQLQLMIGGIEWKLGTCRDGMDTWLAAIKANPDCVYNAMIKWMTGGSSLRNLFQHDEVMRIIQEFIHYLKNNMNEEDGTDGNQYEKLIEFLTLENEKLKAAGPDRRQNRLGRRPGPADEDSSWRSDGEQWRPQTQEPAYNQDYELLRRFSGMDLAIKAQDWTGSWTSTRTWFDPGFRGGSRSAEHFGYRPWTQVERPRQAADMDDNWRRPN